MLSIMAKFPLRTMDHELYSMFQKKNLAMQNLKKLKRSCPKNLVNLVCMHFMSYNPYLHESFELILFLTPPMDNSPWSKREFWPFLKVGKISETGKAMPTKLCVHVFHINPYLYEFVYL